MTTPSSLQSLADRYDPAVFEFGRRHARLRLVGAGPKAFDVLLDGVQARLVAANYKRPDGVLRSDTETWEAIAGTELGGLSAFRQGRLTIRRDLHLGIGFLAATMPPGRSPLRFRAVRTPGGTLSIAEAGQGSTVLLVHGLGATKASFLPTVAALAPYHRVIAVDLPGFGDSDKPITGRYDPAYFARSITSLLDALELDWAHVVGNSMGGRVALEVGLHHADRVGRLVLLAPSLAWIRGRQWATPLRLAAPQLGLLQPAPRPVLEALVRRAVPHANDHWTAAAIDEFLRSYLTPRGRFAFYAAARNIYLEKPYGPNGFWTQLPSLIPESLFVWGERDTLVPIRFAQHVRTSLPKAQHLELNCGHVPQLERPTETHTEILRFLENPSGHWGNAGVSPITVSTPDSSHGEED